MTDRTYYSREAEQRATREQTTTLIAFLAFGLIIGGLVALLFAPSSGKKARSGLLSTIEGGIEEGLETTADTVQRLEKEFRELRKRLEHTIGDLR